MNIKSDYESENLYPEQDEPASENDNRNFWATVVSALLALFGLGWLLIR